MFGQVLGKATELFGKAFLLAGLLPALVLTLGFAAIRNGGSGLVAVAQAVDATRFLDAAVFLLSVLATGSALFVLRARLVAFVEGVPGQGPFQLLREWMIVRKLARKHRAARQRERLTAVYTAVMWASEGFSDALPGDEPDAPASSWWEVEQACRGAFMALARFAREAKHAPVLTPARCSRVSTGLYALQRFAARNRNDPRWRDEAAAWNALLAAPAAKQGLVQAAHHCLRRWRGRWEQAQYYPEDEYMQPTDFGNVLASLGDYAEKRYRIDTALLWNRLWCLLPEADRKEVGDLRLLTEALVVLAFCFLLLLGFAVIEVLAVSMRLAVVSTGAASLPLSHWLPLAVPVAWLLLFWLATPFVYRLAVISLDGMVEKVKSLVDVYHLKLLLAIGLQPRDTGEVALLLDELNRFIGVGEPRKVVRTIAAPAPQRAS